MSLDSIAALCICSIAPHSSLTSLLRALHWWALRQVDWPQRRPEPRVSHRSPLRGHHTASRTHSAPAKGVQMDERQLCDGWVSAVNCLRQPLWPCAGPARRRSDRPTAQRQRRSRPPSSIQAVSRRDQALMSCSHLWNVVDELDSNSALRTITDTLSVNIRLLLCCDTR